MKAKLKKILKNYRKYLIFTIIILVFSLISFYIGKRVGLNTDTTSSNTSIENVKVSKQTITKSITSSGQIEASKTEKLSLNTSYYYSTILVEEDDIVKKGEKIVKYTNGKYLTAPYDLIIKSFNVPEKAKICNNTHNIEVAAFNVLSTTFRVSESKLDDVYIGKTVKIKVPALNDLEIEGIITDITSMATNGRFTATVEFDNNGEIKLGMTVNIIV